MAWLRVQVLKESLLEEGKLLDRIMQAHADNDEHVKQPKASRKGYMGQVQQAPIHAHTQTRTHAHIHTHTHTHTHVSGVGFYRSRGEGLGRRV